MGIKERREREKQITRQAILTAALEIAKQEGWPALTIRKVGEHIEYSGPMIYEYFRGKEEILLELVQEGYRQLTEAMKQARTTTEDRETRMFKIAEAYWQFALDNPVLYQLMYGMGGVPLDRNVIMLAVQASCMAAEEAVQDWTKATGAVVEDTLGAIEIVWSLLHGLVSFTLIDRVAGGEQRARKLMHHAIQDQLMAWKASK